MKIILELSFGGEVTSKKREEVARHIMTSLGDYVDQFATDAVEECQMKGNLQYELWNEP